MNEIKKLPNELINQIAAGEVIESPSALIKELIENSIDANSSKITIGMENLGIKSLIITDNGSGISKENLPNAPIRFATSKISTFDDLYNISTMGFRGEALASLFAISHVKIKSKTKSQEYAYEITSFNIDEPQKTAHNDGTTIEITDLFYNVPARKKYLKSEMIELKSILETITKILLINPQLQLSFTYNSKKLIDKKYSTDSIQSIKDILSIQTNVKFFEINNTTPHIIIKGFIANPNEITYSTSKHCYVYVNSRPIENNLIQKAIINGLGTNIASGRFPLYVLDITIDPQLIDVNVHPTKKEVKFEQEHVIYDSITKAVEGVFNSQLLFKKPDLNLNSKPENPITKSKFNDPFENNFESNFKKSAFSTNNVSHSKNYATPDIQKELVEEKNVVIKEVIQTPRTIQKETQNLEPHYGPLYEYLKEYRIIGQLHKTFILIETKKGLLIIDQHVAEEKFYYELFLSQYLEKEKSNQQLIEPKIIDLTTDELLSFQEYENYFEKLGFEIDLISNSQIAIRSLPLNLKGKVIDYNIVRDILYSIQEFSKEAYSFKEYLIEHLSILSCKSSIRAGDELTFNDMKSIIEQLKVLKEPFNCPHGRPIIIEYSIHDLEKMFKR